MDFETPQRLWLLLGLPPLALWAWRAARLRTQGWATLGRWGRAPGERSIGILIVLALIVLALARPRIGLEPDQETEPGHDVILVFDVSRSMAAEDATPHRLGLAVETSLSLIGELSHDPANRAGVVAFAGRGVLRCPLTQNMGAVIDAINRLQSGDVRPGGTDLGAALNAAVDAFDPSEHGEGRTVVIFSDGEDHEERWERALERAMTREVVVHTIALGEAEPGVHVPSGSSHGPLQYQGEPVVSRRRDLALETIAERSGGAAIKLGLATTDLGLLYQERIAPVVQARRRASRASQRPERFPIAITAALGLLIFACRPGERPHRFRRPTRNAISFLALGLAVSQIAADSKPETTADIITRGFVDYERAQYAEALAAFQEAADRAPNRPIPLYNAAATLYQMGRHAEAHALYEVARSRADAALRTKIDYAMGNTAIQLGDFMTAVRHYDACLASSAPGQALDAVRQDAAINRGFALELLQGSLANQDSPTREDGPAPETSPESADVPKEDIPGEDPDGRSPDDPDSSDPRETDASSPRRQGGAGGDASPPPGASPDDRLDSAVEQIRDARRRRLPDAPLDETPYSDGKDW